MNKVMIVKEWMSIAVVLLMSGVSLAEIQVSVQGSGQTSENVPVTVLIDQAWGDEPAVVVDKKTGEQYAGQADEMDGKPALSWILPKLIKGERREFLVRKGTPEGWKASNGVMLVQSEKGLEINIDGENFTTYLTSAGPKPYFWPVIGPTGKPVTRAFPMKTDVPGERHDHPHHRSFWFTFDRVNGHDFWSELPKASKSVHQKFEKVVSGPVFGEFTSHVDWISKEGEKVCQDLRTMRVWRVSGARLIDADIRWQASEGPLEFGDSKEGLFGFRVAGTMKVDQKGNEDKSLPEGGTLVNSSGEKNDQTWGKRAEWCDYFGPVDGAVVGIAIFDNPANFRHPTYWHSRTYGLFAANPFGISHFTGDKNRDGSHKLSPGEELRLRYRVYIHKGNNEEGKVAEHYADYARPPKTQLE